MMQKMEGIEILNLMGNIDVKYIEEAEEERRRSWFRFLPSVAVVCLCLVVGIAGIKAGIIGGQKVNNSQQGMQVSQKVVTMSAEVITETAEIQSESDSETASDNTNYIQNEFSMEYLSFEELVKRSNIAVVAEYVETIRHDNYVEQKFLVKECLYGNVDEKEIYLYSNIGTVHVEEIDYEYSEDASIYEKHTDYVLILEKSQSIFYEHDRYMLDADVLLDDSNKEYRMYSNPVELPEGVTIREYVCSLHEAIQHQEVTANKSAVYDDDYEEMMGKSVYVGRVSILEMVNEGKVHNGNVYRCKVEELIKGDKLETYEDGTILITIVKDRVSVGNKYVIGFNPADEHSVIYVQSTLSGIYNE